MSATVRLLAPEDSTEMFEYDSIRILDSGWIKCMSEEPHKSTKYYPQDQVFEVYGESVHTGDANPY